MKGSETLTDFARVIPKHLLDIEDKRRSNLFCWRGQFSPQLIECLLDAYCPDGAIVLDPFVGSGTVLYEAAARRLPAYGYEINPSAWSFSKVYEFANTPVDARRRTIHELRTKVEEEFPIVIFSDEALSMEVVEEKVIRMGAAISDEAKILCNALVVLLDLFTNRVTNDFIQAKCAALAELVLRLPCSTRKITADLQDARALPLEAESVDFVISSPPYINVFNYHQNYRRSAEILGWDLLRVARSEIGSNRANRGNRFFTVVQYCIDMTKVIQELARVLKPKARAVLIVGHESKVLGTSFYNADLIERIALRSGMFSATLRQKRTFTNRFGESIREDVLNLTREASNADQELSCRIGRTTAHSALDDALARVPEANRHLLLDAIERTDAFVGTPLFTSDNYAHYQTRNLVMMVREDQEEYMSEKAVKLPTPHLDKLTALLQNPRLPSDDEPRVQQALKRYRQWIQELERVKQGEEDAVEQLVEATNTYKKAVELDLIFDSPGDFLYRQKGQLKLDNTILEEFLPQLVFRGVRLGNATLEMGPRSTFAGLSFASSLASPGAGGKPSLRTKDQDFILGKRLYMMTSFDKDFQDAETVESHLGYVCIECKTNLDKTMFQEAVATSRDLKMAVPSSLYFLVCEFLDMTPVSITPTHIDDVLIVRKAKRMASNIRQEYRTAEERRNHRKDYASFVDSAKYYPDVFRRMIEKIQAVVADAAPDTDKVLEQGHF